MSDQLDSLILIAQAMKSGLPLSEAIRLSVGDRPRSSERPLIRLVELLEKGHDPKDAIRNSGLDSSTASLFEAAMNDNHFELAFDEFSKIEAGEALIRRTVRESLSYPFFIGIFSMLMSLAALFIIVPKFKVIFDDFGVELPAMTEFLMSCSRFIQAPAFYLSVAVFFGTFFLYAKFFFPRFQFYIPVLGGIFRDMNRGRILRMLSFFIRRGVPIPEALEQCGRTFSNVADRNDCRSAADSARNGMPMDELVLRFHWLFPAWLGPLLAAATTPDAIVRALNHAADAVDRQKQAMLLTLKTLCEPLCIILVGGVCGFFVIAMFLPLVKFISALSG